MPLSRRLFDNGMVVWARSGPFPWWPARVVSSVADEGGHGAKENEPSDMSSNRTVQFFNDGDKVGVVKIDRLLEFTSNMDKIKSSFGKEPGKIAIACKEAQEYIFEHGKDFQQEMLFHNPNVVRQSKEATNGSSADSDEEELAAQVEKNRGGLEAPRGARKRAKRETPQDQEFMDSVTPIRKQKRLSCGEEQLRSVSDDDELATRTRVEKKRARMKRARETSFKDTQSLKGDEHNVGPANKVCRRDSCEGSGQTVPTDIQRLDHLVSLEKACHVSMLGEEELSSVTPNENMETNVSVARNMLKAVLHGSEEWVEELENFVSKLEQIRKVRQALLQDINDLEICNFSVQEIVESKMGHNLVHLADRLEPLSVQVRNRLVRVMLKQKQQGEEDADKVPPKTVHRSKSDILKGIGRHLMIFLKKYPDRSVKRTGLVKILRERFLEPMSDDQNAYFEEAKRLATVFKTGTKSQGSVNFRQAFKFLRSRNPEHMVSERTEKN